MKKYLIDSNSFISPYRTFYQFNLIPSFWEWLKDSYDDSLYLIDKVKAELCHAQDDNKDDLQLWIEENCLSKGKIIYPNTDMDVLEKYKDVLSYVNESPYYSQKSYRQWADFEKADPWLIAVAKAHDYTIVTMEERIGSLNANSPMSKEPRIPDVCDAVGVECIDLFEFMQEKKCVI